MDKEIFNNLKQWMRDNRRNIHKTNLTEYLQERICKYASQENTPSEQIKGMNRLLKDIINLSVDGFEEKA